MLLPGGLLTYSVRLAAWACKRPAVSTLFALNLRCLNIDGREASEWGTKTDSQGWALGRRGTATVHRASA